MSTTALDTHAELVEQLDQRVREAVRGQGVDPQRDAPVVRRIAETVVRDHDERSLTGVVAPVPDAAAVVGELVARVSGFGPLQPFLDDPAVEEIWINDPSRVFVARQGRHELTNLILSAAQVNELVERMLKSSGRRIDLSRPFVDAMLPDGHRLPAFIHRMRTRVKSHCDDGHAKWPGRNRHNEHSSQRDTEAREKTYLAEVDTLHAHRRREPETPAKKRFAVVERDTVEIRQEFAAATVAGGSGARCFLGPRGSAGARPARAWRLCP